METAIAKAKTYLDERRGERVTLQELARAVGASPFHLQRRFKQAFGISPRDYQDAQRLAGAEPHPAGTNAHLRRDRARHRQSGRRARGGQRVRRQPGGAGGALPPRGAHRRRARRLRLGHRAEETTPGAGEADEEMRAADFGRLVALAAIWGASFLFTRIVAPVLGPALTADLRMLVAGLALVAYFRLAGFDPDWRRWGGKYAFVGLLNSGLPFLLYAYSALYLS